MKLHEFLNDDMFKIEILNETAIRAKLTNTVYGPDGSEQVCSLDEHISDMCDGQLVYYSSYYNGLCGTDGYLVIDAEGNIIQDKVMGIS